MIWNHATVITTNLFLLVTFQSLFFIYYANELMLNKLRAEAREFGNTTETCSLIVPNAKESMNVMLQMSSPTSTEELEISREKKDKKNSRIHKRLLIIGAVVLGLLILFAIMGVRNKQLKPRELALIVGGSCLGYVSEVFFFFLVVKKYKFFTYKDFIYHFSKNH